MGNRKEARIFNLHPALLAVIYLLTLCGIVGSILSITMLDNIYLQSGIDALAFGLMVLSGITLPSTVKRLKSFVSAKTADVPGGRHLARMRTDYDYKTLITSLISMAVSFAFAAYYLYSGIKYVSGWYYSMSVYAFMLTVLRLILFLIGFRCESPKLDDMKKKNVKSVWWLIDSVLLFVLDLLLIVPITYVGMFAKSVDSDMIMSITVAAYAFYKITVSSINFVKARKSSDITTKFFRDINITDALVTMLSLAYTLITVNSEDGSVGSGMRVMVIVFGFFVFASSLTLASLTLIRTIKNRKNFRRELNESR